MFCAAIRTRSDGISLDELHVLYMLRSTRTENRDNDENSRKYIKWPWLHQLLTDRAHLAITHQIEEEEGTLINEAEAITQIPEVILTHRAI